MKAKFKNSLLFHKHPRLIVKLIELLAFSLHMYCVQHLNFENTP